MNKNNQNFETNITRLEQIVRAMESGDISLDESVKLFQEGTELIRACEKLLDEAEFNVKKVLAAADGSPREEAFISDAEY